MVDGIVGYFQPPPDLFNSISAYPIYLGNDTGLQHSYVDQNVENGRRYYYAVVVYSKGDATLGILPAENSKTVTISSSGQVSADINVAVVVPNSKTAGYVAPVSGDTLIKESNYGTGSIIFQVLDPTQVTTQ